MDDDDELESDSEVIREKYVAVLFYIGFGYCGWQRQTADSDPKKDTGHHFIQECLEDSAKLAVPESIGVSACASGRTDAGTNASGQVVHIVFRYLKSSPQISAHTQWTSAQWTQHCAQVAHGLNAHLPHDIRVRHLFSFPIHFPPQLNFFHARKSAQWKQYSFYVQQGGVYMVDWAPFCFFFKEKFDIEILKRELAAIKGEHDFQNFVNDTKNLPAKTRFTIPEISLSFLHKLNPDFPSDPRTARPCVNPDAVPSYAAAHKQPVLAQGAEPPYVLRIRIVGSGFLRHMVRRLVGSLHWVITGKAKEGIFARVLNDGVHTETATNNIPNTSERSGQAERNNLNIAETSGEMDATKEEKTTNEDKETIDAGEIENNTDKPNSKINDVKGKRKTEDCEKIEKSENVNAPTTEGGYNEIRKNQRKKHRGTKMPKKERKEFLGPATSARGLWLEKVWYEEGWCVQPENLPLEFTPFVDCSFSTNV